MSLTIDRYHAQMGDASTRTYFDQEWMSDVPVRFYATQRKLHFAPILGHDRFVSAVGKLELQGYEREFLVKNRLSAFASAQRGGVKIRAATPGTIMFAEQPFLDASGPFLATQALEIAVEHSFDTPMTVGSRAMDMKRAAGKHTVMDFSLRRDGDADRAFLVAQASYIGGFDQTSNGDAGRTGIPWVGTVAHYWQQMFVGFHGQDGKHWQQIAFEKWLDANPQGTTLLLDTISVELGVKHAIAAALSTPERRRAFKAFRIDAGDLFLLACEALWDFRNAGLNGLVPILTGDLDTEQISHIVDQIDRSNEELPELDLTVFGVGTKLISEVGRVAGVIYKLSEVDGLPTFKGSKNTPEKATLPGRLQVLRGINKNGSYVGDVTTLENSGDMADSKELLRAKGAVRYAELLQDFVNVPNLNMHLRSFEQQREFVAEQLSKFGYLMNYPTMLSPQLTALRRDLMVKYS